MLKFSSQKKAIPETISSRINLLPDGLRDVCLKLVANGELYSFSFCKPAHLAVF